MKKHNIFLTANIVFVVGSASLYGYGKWREHQMDNAHEAQIQQLVDRYKACPDTLRQTGECYDDNQRSSMVRQAEESRSAGRYLEAGQMYARLGREYENDAREMAGRCNESDRRTIINEIEIRQEATRRSGSQ